MKGGKRPALLPKTKQSGLMVSDFIDEFQQHQHVNPNIQQHERVVFKYGIECGGYWAGDRFKEQMKTASDIAQIKYPPTSHTVVLSPQS